MLALVAHVYAVITEPGYLPKNYEALNDELLPSKFYRLIDEREEQHAEFLVKRLMRKAKVS